MGLTGVVVKATLRLIRVETSWMETDTERCDDLDAVMSAMEEADHNYRYSVAWVDCSSRGKHLGRSVLTRGDHAPIGALGLANATSFIDIPAESRVRVPFTLPLSAVGPHTVQAFNALWFRKSPKRKCGAIVPLTSFFYPLDGINEWNLLYGRRGFVQYQFVVGPQHADVVRAAVGMMGPAGIPSSLAVLKRFGPGDPGPLSFPIEGWTLALDFPAGLPGLPPLLDRLDELVVGVGGRIYLAKDARLRPELLRAMYPRIGELEAVRDRVDPDHVLQSDLSRRLGIGQKVPS
jgi:decaprenylphospho-beta-D-ribofuranose 2-oxidase